jgi:lysophospholipase L1-like esterase
VLRAGALSRRWKLLWTAAALFVGLAVAEIAARCLHAELPARPRVEGDVVARSSDPDLRFENLPLAEQCNIYPQARRAADKLVFAHVNEQGWRGRTVPLAHSPGVFRIAALGYSHTFGLGVADDEPWPAVLELRLAQAGARVEVMNCGVNGYDAEQVCALLAKRVLTWSPDLVVYGFFSNDSALPGAQAPPGIRYDPSEDDDTRSNTLGWLRDHSSLADLILTAAHRSAVRARWADLQTSQYSEEYEGWQRMRAALRHAREQVEARGARFVVVLIPRLVSARSELVSSGAHRTMSAFCRSANIPCLDLEPCFRGLDLDELRVHPYDLHFGARAHALAAEALSSWLLEQHLLDAR